jgi:arsenate reductase
MNKIYCLSGCSTCKMILAELSPAIKGFTLQDIKGEKITDTQIEEMKKLAGSYEALFSRRARKFVEMGLKDKKLGEMDYRALILEEYTFLKRPVAIVGSDIFIGSEKKVQEALKKKLKRSQGKQI